MYTRSIYARMFPDLEQEPLKVPEKPVTAAEQVAPVRTPMVGAPKPPGQPLQTAVPPHLDPTSPASVPAPAPATELDLRLAAPGVAAEVSELSNADAPLPMDEQALQAVGGGQPIANAFEYPFPQPANEKERKANKQAEKQYEKTVAEANRPKFKPDPNLSPEENRLAQARFDMENLTNKDKGAKGLIRELLQNFLYGMGKAGSMPGVSVAQALTLGATGAGAGFVNKTWNEQRALEQQMPELEKAAGMGMQRRNTQADNDRADRQQRLATQQYQRGVLNDVAQRSEREVFKGPNGQFFKKSKTGEIEIVNHPISGQPLTENDVAVRLRDGRVVYTTGDKAIDREIAEDYRYAQMEWQAGKWNAEELSDYEEKLDAWSQDTVKFQRDLAGKEAQVQAAYNEAQWAAHMASQTEDPEEKSKLMTKHAEAMSKGKGLETEIAKIRDKAPPRPQRTRKSLSAPGQPNRSAEPIAIPEANAAEAIRRTREKNPSLKSDEEARKLLASRGYTFR